MHPKKLIGYYDDEFETTEIMRFKYIILDSIISNIDLDNEYIITKKNVVEIQQKTINTNDVIPLARRLFTITE